MRKDEEDKETDDKEVVKQRWRENKFEAGSLCAVFSAKSEQPEHLDSTAEVAFLPLPLFLLILVGTD